MAKFEVYMARSYRHRKTIVIEAANRVEAESKARIMIDNVVLDLCEVDETTEDYIDVRELETTVTETEQEK
jgi:nicotinate-nucleotide pyrophosphorylase